MNKRANYYALLITILTDTTVSQALKIMGIDSHEIYVKKGTSKIVTNKAGTSQ